MTQTSIFVDELYIVAGPRSSGKSTFIDWCKTASQSHEIPSQFTSLSNFDEPVYFVELGKFAETFHQKLLVHVDIFTPFTDMLMLTEAALIEALSAGKFLDYPSTPYLKSLLLPISPFLIVFDSNAPVFGGTFFQKPPHMGVSRDMGKT